MDHLRRNPPYLVIILAVAILLRIGAAFYFGNQVIDLPGTNDQITYQHLATRIIDGHGFSFARNWWPATQAGEPTAHWSYLYTFFLTGVYSLFGVTPIIARLLQAILVGILHPLLAYLIGRELYGEKVGLVTAGLTAVYIYFFYYAGTLMTEPFYITGILASLYMAMRWNNRANRPGEPFMQRLLPGILLGIVAGLTILLRQLFMLMIPFILLWIWWSGWRRKEASRLPGLLVTAAIIVAMIVPFTFYNYSRFERFVLLNTNAGFAFYWGNHPIHGSNFISILPTSYEELLPDRLYGLDEAALDSELLKLGLGFVRDDPGRYILLSINRLKDYFLFWPTAESSLVSNISRVFSFGILLPFMLYGIWLAFKRRNLATPMHLDQSPALLLLFCLLYTGTHLLTWTLVRYRLPVDAVMLVFAGLAVAEFGQRLPFFRHKSLPESKATSSARN
jgi:4-amino-4-deoxy-L-arabinose transferase-like glycosyltransferase